MTALESLSLSVEVENDSKSRKNGGEGVFEPIQRRGLKCHHCNGLGYVKSPIIREKIIGSCRHCVADNVSTGWKVVICKKCFGTRVTVEGNIIGSGKNAEGGTCHTCKGRGIFVRRPNRKEPNGCPCPVCGGSKLIKKKEIIFSERKKCTSCNGKGELKNCVHPVIPYETGIKLSINLSK